MCLITIKAMNKSTTHNLDIQLYSLNELLTLFDLKSQISIEDLKRAKMKVLMTHPDKSRLPAEYFLFYKKAFDIIVEFYKSQSKETQKVTAENAQYAVLPNMEYDKNIHSRIKKMDAGAFNAKFNQLFDQNMSTSMKTTHPTNEWFKEETAQYDMTSIGKNVNQGIETVKQQQQQQQQQQNIRGDIIVHSGVQSLHSTIGASDLYDDDDDDTTARYITSDPFSKLKFDDLRKVHKNETVFAVSERDLAKMPKYSSVDQFAKERNQMILTPLEKKDAQRLLDSQEKQNADRIMRKEYESKLQSMKYAEKNKSVMASFLHLGN